MKFFRLVSLCQILGLYMYDDDMKVCIVDSTDSWHSSQEFVYLSLPFFFLSCRFLKQIGFPGSRLSLDYLLFSFHWKQDSCGIDAL